VFSIVSLIFGGQQFRYVLHYVVTKPEQVFLGRFTLDRWQVERTTDSNRYQRAMDEIPQWTFYVCVFHAGNAYGEDGNIVMQGYHC